MRTLVLVAAVLLVVTLGMFLSIARWRNHLNYREMLKPLGADIQQEANGVTYTQSSGGHTLFKLHASKVEELKQSHRELLHDVNIEFYGTDGKSVDRIDGKEFEYDQKTQTALAKGPVEITLMRPSEAPAIAPNALPGQAAGGKAKVTPLAAAAHTAASSAIHVQTSGLTFDRKSGVATTDQHVDFALAQGSGSSIGARYESENGLLVLDHAVALNVQRGPELVQVQAHHAEFERGELLCHLTDATANYRGGQATAGKAEILFRPDGSAVRLNASAGFGVTTLTRAHMAAPTGLLEFDEHNQPTHGHLEGGVTMDSASNGRQVKGSAPAADFAFATQGELRKVHLERGVLMHSESVTEGQGGPVRVNRDWRSPVADLEFRDAGHGQVELAGLHGTGGVMITGETQRGTGPLVPSRMAADEVTGVFGVHQTLTEMTGVGHGKLEETTAAGARQQTSGDRIDARFLAGQAVGVVAKARSKKAVKPVEGGSEAAAEIQWATVDGNVVLQQQPVAKPGGVQEPTLRATAEHALYEGAGEWLHLMGSPRVEDGGLQLTADKVDVSQASGDAFAHGNVKATWMEANPPKTSQSGIGQPGAMSNAKSSIGLGGQGPAHVIAAEAQLKQATGEATFTGQARLWQQANSVAAPVIVLDRTKRTLVARSTSAADLVKVVLLSAGGVELPGTGDKSHAAKDGGSRTPSVIRVRGADLKYSDAERKAVIHGGSGSVVAEAAAATSVSNDVELVLLPPGNHAGNDGGAAQVERMTASGHVSVSSQGRKGTGERLVYSSESEEYVLTGTAAAPPRMTDPIHGMVTGESLIFNSRDDSVSIEGGGRKTTTETRAPK